MDLKYRLLISYDSIRKKMKGSGGGKKERGLQQMRSRPDKQYPNDSTRIADVVVRIDMGNEQQQACNNYSFLATTICN
jgi:hypothetical protein